MIEFVKPRHADISHVLGNLRRADIEEAEATLALPAPRALLLTMQQSRIVLAGVVDGEPMFLFGLGVGSYLAGVMRPWMVGTPALRRHAKRLLPMSRDVVEGWADDWRLENWVDARHAESRRWLEWLGFTLAPAAPFGAFDYLFHCFSMERGACAS